MRPQFLKLAIFRPEIMAPLADAMRLVDGELGDIPVYRALQKRIEHQALRRDVKHAVLAAMQTSPARHSALAIQR